MKLVSRKQNSKKLQSYYFGLWVEYLAISFLLLRGYKILKKRYRNYFGEIDLIAKKHDLLLIIEVKARGTVTVIEEVLSNQQQIRIKKAAEYFVAKNKEYQSLGIRFDLIIIEPFKWPVHLIGFWN